MSNFWNRIVYYTVTKELPRKDWRLLPIFSTTMIAKTQTIQIMVTIYLSYPAQKNLKHLQWYQICKSACSPSLLPLKPVQIPFKGGHILAVFTV